jgi:hypothetical protein
VTRTVLVTGAAGRLGTYLRDRPPPGWTPRWTDLVAAEGIVAADVTDLEAMTDACHGATAVVHLAGIPTDADWPDLLHVNVTGTRTVLEAAHRQGVRRVVLAGSNHAVGFTPRGSGDLVRDAAPRPDSAYGFTKAAVEAPRPVVRRPRARGRHPADRVVPRPAELHPDARHLALARRLQQPDRRRPRRPRRRGGPGLGRVGQHAALVVARRGRPPRLPPRDDAESHAASVDLATAGPGDDRVGGCLPPAQASQPGRTRPVS